MNTNEKLAREAAESIDIMFDRKLDATDDMAAIILEHIERAIVRLRQIVYTFHANNCICEDCNFIRSYSGAAPQPQPSEQVSGRIWPKGHEKPQPVPQRSEQQETANVHIEHYFPKGYDSDQEPWKSIRKFHKAALAAERQRRVQAEEQLQIRATEYVPTIKLLALKEQLLSAQAAIEKAKKRTWALAEKWPELEYVDLSLLDDFKKEVRKPLVELLELLEYDENGHVTAWPSQKAWADAMVKEGK